MDNIGTFLDLQPFIALFMVIGLGNAVGRISIGCLALGSGAILFTGPAVGVIAPKSAPPGFLRLIGLVAWLLHLCDNVTDFEAAVAASTARMRKEFKDEKGVY